MSFLPVHYHCSALFYSILFYSSSSSRNVTARSPSPSSLFASRPAASNPASMPPWRMATNLGKRSRDLDLGMKPSGGTAALVTQSLTLANNLSRLHRISTTSGSP
ncbi:hypothetical protein LY78DRAFT_33099 [Colletotrichum sublineola]|nr:hypothetical protein LY78DRAFT_33099 [Colletotrichum sublineola]